MSEIIIVEGEIFVDERGKINSLIIFHSMTYNVYILYITMINPLLEAGMDISIKKNGSTA